MRTANIAQNAVRELIVASCLSPNFHALKKVVATGEQQPLLTVGGNAFPGYLPSSGPALPAFFFARPILLTSQMLLTDYIVKNI